MTPEQRSEQIEKHLPLVGYHVSETISRVPSHVDRDDLASAGAVALVRAFDAYDASTGVPFNRYAAIRIRGAILDELRSLDWASRGTRARVRRVTAITESLTAELGRAPSREQLASALGIEVVEVDAAQADASRKVLSIDAYDGVLGDVLPTREMGPEESLLVDERLSYLRAAIEVLPERLRGVVEQVFFADRSVTEIAAEMGVTQSRVSQLRAEALVMLRDGMNSHLAPERVTPAANATGIVQRRREAYFTAVGDHARGLQSVSSARKATIAAQAASAATAATPLLRQASSSAHLVALA